MSSDDNAVAELQWKLEYPAIQAYLYKASQIEAHGIPCTFSIKNCMLITGTTEGITFVFDWKRNVLLQTLGLRSAEGNRKFKIKDILGKGRVYDLSISDFEETWQAEDEFPWPENGIPYVAASYASGDIIIWNAESGKILKQVFAASKSSHFSLSQVFWMPSQYSGLASLDDLVLISVSSLGQVHMHIIHKNVLLTKIESTIIMYLHLPQSVIADKDEKVFFSVDFLRTGHFCLLAVITANYLVVCSISHSVEVIYEWKFGDDVSFSSVFLSWRPLDSTMPDQYILAYMLDDAIHFYEIEYSESLSSDSVIEMRSPSLLSLSGSFTSRAQSPSSNIKGKIAVHAAFNTIKMGVKGISLFWITKQFLGCFTENNNVIVYDVYKNSLQSNNTLEGFRFVLPILGDHRVSTFIPVNERLFFLCENGLIAGRLPSWQQKYAIKNDYPSMQRLQLLVDILVGNDTFVENANLTISNESSKIELYEAISREFLSSASALESFIAAGNVTSFQTEFLRLLKLWSMAFLKSQETVKWGILQDVVFVLSNFQELKDDLELALIMWISIFENILDVSPVDVIPPPPFLHCLFAFVDSCEGHDVKVFRVLHLIDFWILRLESYENMDLHELISFSLKHQLLKSFCRISTVALKDYVNPMSLLISLLSRQLIDKLYIETSKRIREPLLTYSLPGCHISLFSHFDANFLMKDLRTKLKGNEPSIKENSDAYLIYAYLSSTISSVYPSSEFLSSSQPKSDALSMLEVLLSPILLPSCPLKIAQAFLLDTCPLPFPYLQLLLLFDISQTLQLFTGLFEVVSMNNINVSLPSFSHLDLTLLLLSILFPSFSNEIENRFSMNQSCWIFYSHEQRAQLASFIGNRLEICLDPGPASFPFLQFLFFFLFDWVKSVEELNGGMSNLDVLTALNAFYKAAWYRTVEYGAITKDTSASTELHIEEINNSSINPSANQLRWIDCLLEIKEYDLCFDYFLELNLFEASLKAVILKCESIIFSTKRWQKNEENIKSIFVNALLVFERTEFPSLRQAAESVKSQLFQMIVTSCGRFIQLDADQFIEFLFHFKGTDMVNNILSKLTEDDQSIQFRFLDAVFSGTRKENMSSDTDLYFPYPDDESKRNAARMYFTLCCEYDTTKVPVALLRLRDILDLPDCLHLCEDKDIISGQIVIFEMLSNYVKVTDLYMKQIRDYIAQIQQREDDYSTNDEVGEQLLTGYVGFLSRHAKSFTLEELRILWMDLLESFSRLYRVPLSQSRRQLLEHIIIRFIDAMPHSASALSIATTMSALYDSIGSVSYSTMKSLHEELFAAVRYRKIISNYISRIKASEVMTSSMRLRNDKSSGLRFDRNVPPHDVTYCGYCSEILIENVKASALSCSASQSASIVILSCGHAIHPKCLSRHRSYRKIEGNICCHCS